MPKRYSSKELIAMIERNGWREVRQSGSHKQFKHPYKIGLVTIPHPVKELHPKTAASILMQAGLKGD